MPNMYAGAPIDRASARRRDAVWLDRAAASAEARTVVLSRFRVPVTRDTAAPRLVTVHPSAIGGVHTVFLGVWEGVPIFAAELGEIEPTLHPAFAGRDVRFAELREVGPLLDRAEGGILAYARGILWWQARSGFCGVCGSPAVSEDAGFSRRCSNPECGVQHFPRTDPAIIVLIDDGEGRVVLSRQRRWAPRIHSLIAGFVEPGESLEDAVAREVMEEVGLELTDIRYHSTQPWPFPTQLMFGFRARAAHRELRVDLVELERALWVEREVLRNVGPDTEIQYPTGDSVARRMILEWLAEG